MPTISKKICMVGDFGVGKTSLIRQFLDHQFSDHYLSTIGVKLSRKQMRVRCAEAVDQPMQLMVWDIEGKTQFQAIAPSYLEGAMGGIIVADLNRKETVDRLQEHIALISTVNPIIGLVIALNKVDLSPINNASIILNEQLSLFQTNPQVVSVYLTSAKTGEAVDQLFQALAVRLWQNHQAHKISLQRDDV